MLEPSIEPLRSATKMYSCEGREGTENLGTRVKASAVVGEGGESDEMKTLGADGCVRGEWISDVQRGASNPTDFIINTRSRSRTELVARDTWANVGSDTELEPGSRAPILTSMECEGDEIERMASFICIFAAMVKSTDVPPGYVPCGSP